MSEVNAFTGIQCRTLEHVFLVIQWAHERRRQWKAETIGSGWKLEIEIIGFEEHEMLHDLVKS